MFSVKSKSREDKTLFGSPKIAESRRGKKKRGWLLEEEVERPQPRVKDVKSWLQLIN
jgi:hypothetical protein